MIFSFQSSINPTYRSINILMTMTSSNVLAPFICIHSSKQSFMRRKQNDFGSNLKNEINDQKQSKKRERERKRKKEKRTMRMFVILILIISLSDHFQAQIYSINSLICYFLLMRVITIEYIVSRLFLLIYWIAELFLPPSRECSLHARTLQNRQ